MTFSEKLVGLRRKAGLSQEQLAERLEVTRQTISKWETGRSVPDLEKLEAMKAGEECGSTLRLPVTLIKRDSTRSL